MMMFRKHLQASDRAALAAIVQAVDVFLPEEVEVALELVDDSIALQAASHYRFILAEQAGRVVGYSCYGRIPMTDERYDLYWLVVDHTTQRQGIARAVLAETIHDLQALNGKSLYAETSSRDVYRAAQQFYLNAHFSEVARLEHYYRDNDDKIIYQKLIR